jgi:hypothetical protein
LQENDMIEADRTKCLRIALLLVGIVAQTGALSAQEAVKHLNPVIEKLAAGKPFIGFQTGDLSLQNARTLARADIDYVYMEMELYGDGARADGFCGPAPVYGRHDRQSRHPQEG